MESRIITLIFALATILMDFTDQYRKTHTEFLKIEKEIVNDISLSAYQNSLRCLYYKVKSIGLIKDSILDSRNNYSQLILYRSLVEHYLVACYVSQRVGLELSDKVGEEYYDSYANSEFFKQETYSIQLEQIKNGHSGAVNMDILKQKYPDLTELTQEDLEQYHKVGNYFSNIKKIGDFLIKNKNREPYLNQVNEKTFELLEKYNFLSSYVHGGPYAERETLYINHDVNASKDKNIIDNWALLLCSITEINLVMALTLEFHDKYSNSFRKMYQ